MIAIPLAAVDTGALLKVVIGALIASVGVTAIVALTVLGASRWEHARNRGDQVQAIAYGILATAGALGTVAAVVVAFVVMTAK
jgi:hypothetical protein